jgi:hypothetical protein
VLIDGDSCGFVDHVNGDDEKLNTSITKEEDQRSILIIGGIKIFLTSSQVKTSAHDESEAEEERQPAETVKEEEMEQTLMSTPVGEDEHSEEWLKILSRKPNRR